MRLFTFDCSQTYEEIYKLQKNLVQSRIEDKILDTLLLGEHPDVITLGRGSRPENLLETNGIPVVEIERGGDVTYHGPGQLVVYPVFKLNGSERDLHGYLRRLEEVLIKVLKTYDIKGNRRQGWTGVWVGEYKIASIGVAIRKWVTYHGFALNVLTDLTRFSRINPCGLPADVMISIEQLCTEKHPVMQEIQQSVLKAFEEVFDRSLVNASQVVKCNR